MERRSTIHAPSKAIALALLCGLECSSSDVDDRAIDGDAAPPSPSKAPLTIDVVINGPSLRVYVREVGRPCRCGFGEWPTWEGCESTTDAGYCTCDPPPGDCLHSVRVERAGHVVKELDDHYFRSGVYSGHVADLFNSAPSEIVFAGCGSQIAIPLPTTQHPEPTVEDLLRRDRQLYMDWTSPGQPDYAVGQLSDGFGGSRCMADGTGSVPMIDQRFVPGRPVTALLMTGDLVWYDATRLGDVRVWNGALVGRDDIPFPE